MTSTTTNGLSKMPQTTEQQTTLTTKSEPETTSTIHDTTTSIQTTSDRRTTIPQTTLTTTKLTTIPLTTSTTVTVQAHTVPPEKQTTQFEPPLYPHEKEDTTDYDPLPPDPEPEPEQPDLPDLPYPYPPLNPPPFTPNFRPKGKGRINSIEEERTAMIIGIVAGILIAVILVILLVLWLKSNGDRNYKTETEKHHTYGSHNQSAALLGNTSTNGSYHQQRQHSQQLNNAGGVGGGNGGGYGGLGNVNGNALTQGVGLVQPKTTKRDSKDVKEWYV